MTEQTLFERAVEAGKEAAAAAIPDIETYRDRDGDEFFLDGKIDIRAITRASLLAALKEEREKVNRIKEVIDEWGDCEETYKTICKEVGVKEG